MAEPSWDERLDDEEEPLYPIGVVAELLDVTVQVVRRYDDSGVVSPARSDGGQRRYSRNDIARLARVVEMSDEGISSAGIRRILELEAELEDLKGDQDDG